jgi:hypothetical protein
VIYIDSSVALAQIFAEDRMPPADLWSQPLTASRLLHYELWNRVHARRLTRTHGDEVRQLLGGIDTVEMIPPVLARAVEPFPTPVRTLDSLHLSTIEFLRQQGRRIELASYDARLLEAARALEISIRAL